MNSEIDQLRGVVEQLKMDIAHLRGIVAHLDGPHFRVFFGDTSSGGFVEQYPVDDGKGNISFESFTRQSDVDPADPGDLVPMLEYRSADQMIYAKLAAPTTNVVVHINSVLTGGEVYKAYLVTAPTVEQAITSNAAATTVSAGDGEEVVVVNAGRLAKAGHIIVTGSYLQGWLTGDKASNGKRVVVVNERLPVGTATNQTMVWNSEWTADYLKLVDLGA